MENQMSLFDIEPEQMEAASDGLLSVVKAKYVEDVKVGWHDLFDGYDELYGITFSSGIQFMEKVFESFEHVEMIFGCEGVLSDELATIISAQIKSVETLVKSKSAKRIAERIEDGSIEVNVSRDTKSHEKIFILRSKDGRVRVITGSANMSASAFLGVQRENIMCFDDQEAYEYYKDLFDMFKENCSDSISEQLIGALIEDEDYIRNNIEKTPIIKTIEKDKILILEPGKDTDDVEYVADIKGLESEIKPLLPRIKPEKGKIIVTGEIVKGFKRKYKDNANVKKAKEKVLPKLHIDYESHRLLFNGKEQNLNPDETLVKKDIDCLISFIDSLSTFYGDYKQSQQDYYRFLNWYFCSPFMPYLRYVGSKNEYGVTNFPVVGILYGDSNGGKTTFIKLLSKLMTGAKINPCSSSDFTATNISNLKASCEGVPINIDDLAKTQYDAHFEKIIKDDNWGILERYVNYPAIVISTNKLASLKQDIAKRVVTCRINIRIDKEIGAYNSKRINESIKYASNAFYCEYMRRMLERIKKMEEDMQDMDQSYFPDILKESSEVILGIFNDFDIEIPDYILELSYANYFGALEIGKYAIDQIKTAWETEPKNFKVDKKKNLLVYSYPEGGRLYELKYLQDELPSALEARVTAKSIVMKLDVACEIFDTKFKKGLFV